MKSESSRSEKPHRTKRAGSTSTSRTDWAALEDPKRAGKATQCHPEFDPTEQVRALVRRGLKPVPAKALISLRIDEDVIEWFRAQGPGYQTRINSVLRAFRDASL